MEERIKIINETGERKADGSVRFSSHPAGDPMSGIMEMVHNMLTYGKSKGTITIEKCGPNLCNYRFYNDADSDMLPTFEKLKEIASTAGKTISANKGVSLCGVGTEVMGLSSRLYQDNFVSGNIAVVRDGFAYGANLTFNGIDKEITYEIINPKECKAENSYEVVFKNCKMVSNAEIIELKRKIVDTMPDDRIKIIFSTDDERTTLVYRDFLYRNKLAGTENYEKHVFHTEDGEEIVFEIADVAKIIKSGKGNEYEENRMCSPDLSGGAIRYKGIATVCRGNDGWKVTNAYGGTHPTRNNIRYDVTIGNYVFHELHKESQVKTKTTITFKDIKDACRDNLKIYDEDENEYELRDIATFIKQFCGKHKSDSNSDKNIEETTLSVSNAVNNGELTMSDINSAQKVLSHVKGRMNTKTLEAVLNTIH